ncbi:hypothetical protein ACFQYP_26985 [Nonomuraea antimicrobica]
MLRAAAAAVISAGSALESLAAEVKAKRQALKEAEGSWTRRPCGWARRRPRNWRWPRRSTG